MPLALIFESGPRAGERVEVVADALLGRENADIVVADVEVSRHHAIVRVTADSAEVEDLGSRNGTFVNGERLSGMHALQTGDRVRIGQTSLRFEAVAAPGETALSANPVPAAADQALETPPPAPFSTAPPMQAPPRVASRQARAAVLSFGTVIATALALVAYFAAR